MVVCFVEFYNAFRSSTIAGLVHALLGPLRFWRNRLFILVLVEYSYSKRQANLLRLYNGYRYELKYRSFRVAAKRGLQRSLTATQLNIHLPTTFSLAGGTSLSNCQLQPY